jgi:hypothetical protein
VSVFESRKTELCELLEVSNYLPNRLEDYHETHEMELIDNINQRFCF